MLKLHSSIDNRNNNSNNNGGGSGGGGGSSSSRRQAAGSRWRVPRAAQYYSTVYYFGVKSLNFPDEDWM